MLSGVSKFLIASLLLVQIGCVSLGGKINQLQLGSTTTEVDHILKDGIYRVIERKDEQDSLIEIRRYMVRDPITRLYRIEQWDLVFKNNKLIGWKYVTGDSSSSGGDRGVGFLCNDAIARGDELAIRVHCK